MNPIHNTRGLPQNTNQQFPQFHQNIHTAPTSDNLQSPIYSSTGSLIQHHLDMQNSMASWGRSSGDQVPLDSTVSMFDIENQSFSNSTAQWHASSNSNPGTFTSGTNSNVLSSADNSPGTFNHGMNSKILNPSYSLPGAFTTNDMNNSLGSSDNTPFALFNGVNDNTFSSRDNHHLTASIIEANKQLMRSMEQNHKLQDSLKAQSGQHEKTVTELQEKIAALEKEKEILANQKYTLKRECQNTRNYVNMLRGYYDFRIGTDGKLLPLVPETDTVAYITHGAPATPLQAAYVRYLKDMIGEHHEQTRRQNVAAAGRRILKADLCHLCPVHNGPDAHLQPSRVTLQPTPTIDLTVDAASAPPSLHRQAANAALAAVQANNTPLGASSEVATQAKDAAVAAAPAASEASDAPSAAPAQVEAVANAATTSEDRPAPLKTPPTSSPEGTASSLPKRENKDRSYSWLQKPQNLGLLKATGLIKDQFEQKKVEDELRLARRAADYADFVAVTSAAASISTSKFTSQPAIAQAASPAARATTTNNKKGNAASSHQTKGTTEEQDQNRSGNLSQHENHKQAAKSRAQLEKSAVEQLDKELDKQPARQAGATASKTTTSTSTTEATTTSSTTATQPHKYYYDDLSDAEDSERLEPPHDQLLVIDHNQGDTIAPLSNRAADDSQDLGSPYNQLLAEDPEDLGSPYNKLLVDDDNGSDTSAPIPKGDIDMGEVNTAEEDPLDDLFEGDPPLMADSDGEISEEN
ncbi:hypothetical protein A1O7_06576 [Cladophialophora yegresii CBS 114405]|uniref:Uncharacterized protein n=1 Tax=Cladophialophora yegresii CBS 114405 TaxID=1182544 RepID=W9W2B9_9EURO|nr:uncharacterized protein A1O7_06576 [Cladophialophora yegresii CBS 114405]EXJ59145.1 hypothetical protein A1O7_06576 [Cladophialophora yegresii CBS 114405]